MTGSTSKIGLLNEHTRHEIDSWVARFPEGRQRSAVLSALRFTQEQNQGFLTPDLMEAVAEYLKLPAIQVFEVASFYSMFETHPCGRHHVSVCTNISCALVGAQATLEAFESELGIRAGETTPDGAFTLRTIECLGGCGWGTVVSCDHRYKQHVKPADVPALIEELRHAEH